MAGSILFALLLTLLYLLLAVLLIALGYAAILRSRQSALRARVATLEERINTLRNEQKRGDSMRYLATLQSDNRRPPYRRDPNKPYDWN